ncbi:MAG TPA: hypothetical protein VMH20_08025 [Verrucomicrobiae bacterium]|nr:hypothetical protein [Verrucomicrobiae bacterium]
MKLSRTAFLFVFALAFLRPSYLPAQQPLMLDELPAASQDLLTCTSLTPQAPQNPSPSATSQDPKAAPATNGSTIDSSKPQTESDQTGVQTKRILGIMPNFRSVSADTYLPPQSFQEKLWLATQDSFDYSAFIYNGIVASISYGENSEPSFGRGIGGYGIYYAHTVADNTIENYLVEAFVPALTKQDPRYYTLGRGGFFKRSGYALSRVFITRTDAGNNTFNISEIAGAGAAAGISNLYYPPGNTWVKTYQRWGSQLLQDFISFEFKEFWPDINHYVFHNKY